MKNSSASIDRLLRAAAAAPSEPTFGLPFGFDTRVLAQWRATWPDDPAAIAGLLRRVMLLAIALIVLASVGAYREFRQTDVPLGDEYAIADSAIGGMIDQ